MPILTSHPLYSPHKCFRCFRTERCFKFSFKWMAPETCEKVNNLTRRRNSISLVNFWMHIYCITQNVSATLRLLFMGIASTIVRLSSCDQTPLPSCNKDKGILIVEFRWNTTRNSELLRSRALSRRLAANSAFWWASRCSRWSNSFVPQSTMWSKSRGRFTNKFNGQKVNN